VVASQGEVLKSITAMNRAEAIEAAPPSTMPATVSRKVSARTARSRESIGNGKSASILESCGCLAVTASPGAAALTVLYPAQPPTQFAVHEHIWVVRAI
jgi:hypothetical protein